MSMFFLIFSKNQVVRERKMNKTIRMKNAILSLIMITLFLGFIPIMSHAGSWNGWIYQNPYPTSNTLLAVKFVTPKKGWLAGEHGTILYTEDGGENWEAQESGTEQDLKSVAFVNEKKGWAVGNGGIIIRTEDAGKRWGKQKEVDVSLHTIFFLNEKEGWVGGGMGTFLHTIDAGKTWNKQDIGTMSDVAGIFFLNPSTGWVLSAGTVYRTKNGGKNWEASELPSVMIGAQSFTRPSDFGWEGSVFFINEKKGWATVGVWYIFQTEDGGKTWQENQVLTSVDRISFTDEKNGCMAASSILCTEDGGKTWNERLGIIPGQKEDVDGYSVALWGLSFADKATGWAVGKNGLIFKSEDGGKSWKIKSGYKPFVYILDSKTSWGIKLDYKTKKPSIVKTEDGGNTWQIQKTFDNPETYDNRVYVEFFFVNSTTGWAVGQETGRDRYKGPLILNYFILGTTDGGKTWVTQFKEPSGEQLGKSNDFQDVYFMNSDLGWAVGRNGFILHTEDGGKLWQRQKSGTKSELWRVQFSNNKKGWVIGNKTIEGSGTSIVLHTDDGGEHWHVQWKKRTGWMWLDELYFIDKNNGWVAGVIDENSEVSILVQTTDGGKTWSEKRFGASDFSKIYFLDKKRGVILTKKGQMIITRDGGKTWNKQETPIRRYPWHVSELFKNK